MYPDTHLTLRLKHLQSNVDWSHLVKLASACFYNVQAGNFYGFHKDNWDYASKSLFWVLEVSSMKHERVKYFLNLSHFRELYVLVWASLLEEVSLVLQTPCSFLLKVFYFS